MWKFFMKMIKYDGPIVTLVNNSITLPLQAVGFVCFAWLFKNAKKARFTKNMVTYIVVGLMFCTVSIPLSVYSLIFWQPVTPAFQPKTLFWFGLPKLVMMSLYPSSFLFVSLERLIHVRFPTRAKNWKKYFNYSAYGARFLLIIQAGVIVWRMLEDYQTLRGDQWCYTYSCLIKGVMVAVYLLIRYTATALNICFVIILLHLMRRRRMQYDSEHVPTSVHQINFNIQKEHSKIIIQAMLLDIFIDFIPHFVAFLIHTYTEPKLIDFGLPPMITSIQVALSGILYVRPWRERLKRSNSTHPS